MPSKKSKTTRKQSKSTGSVELKKMPSLDGPLTKSDLLRIVSDMTGINKKELSLALVGFSTAIKGSLKRSGPGVFTLPGVCKFIVKKMPAKPAREGINPFTGEKQKFKAKPARNVVKIRPLKALKEEVM